MECYQSFLIYVPDHCFPDLKFKFTFAMGCSSTRERQHDQAIEMAQERDMQQRMGWGGRPTPSRQRAIQERIRQLNDLSPTQGTKVLPLQSSSLVEVDVDVQETSFENCLEPQPTSPNVNPLFTQRHRPNELLPGISSDVELQSQCSSV